MEKNDYDRGHEVGYDRGFIDGQIEGIRSADKIAHKVFKIRCTKENPCELCRDMEKQHG